MTSEPDQAPAAPPPSVPARRVGVLALTAVVWLAIDVVTKMLVVANNEGRPPVKLLGGFIWISVIRNPGAAFGLATGLTWILSLVMIAVIVALVWIAPRLRSVGWAIGLGLVLAGALGNLADRLFRSPGPMRGHVVDFFSFLNPYGTGWAIFNVADAGICIGGALIVLLALLGKDYDGKRTKDKQAKSEVKA